MCSGLRSSGLFNLPSPVHVALLVSNNQRSAGGDPETIGRDGGCGRQACAAKSQQFNAIIVPDANRIVGCRRQELATLIKIDRRGRQVSVTIGEGELLFACIDVERLGGPIATGGHHAMIILRKGG